MATLNMSAAQEALKIFYLPMFRRQLNDANAILAEIERNKESVVGSEIRMALRYGRQGGIGNRADDGNMPTPNSRKTKQAKWETKNIFAHIYITDKTMKASRSNVGAFADLLQAELEDAASDSKDSMDRQVFGDGSGKLATCAVNAAGTTLVVDNTQYFAEGQLIDILDNVAVAKAQEREVTNVDDDAKTITISGAAVATVATDFITIAGSYNQELTGFGKVFTADNTLYGIPRAQNKWFNPTIKALNGEISEVGIQQLIDDCERKAGGNIDFLASSYGVRRGYQNLMLATKQNTDVLTLKGGYKALAYVAGDKTMPFTVDKYAPAGNLYGLDRSTWGNYEMDDWDWLDQDGAVLKLVSGKAVWEAVLAKYSDIGCSKPRGNFRATGIVEH